ncbi:ribosomal RNA-processing protein 8 [Rhinophrynus dorsalis]
MFELSDWNDVSDAQSLTPPLEREQDGVKTDKVVVNKRKRMKKNRQLLEILRTLETPCVREQDFQSEDIRASPKQKVTHKRRKKRECTDSKQQLSDVSQQPGRSPRTPPQTVSPQTASSTGTPLSDSKQRLSRQQWRNKLKNKKRNRNKFRSSLGAGRGDGLDSRSDCGVKSNVTSERDDTEPRTEASEAREIKQGDKSQTGAMEPGNKPGGKRKNRKPVEHKSAGSESHEDMETAPTSRLKKVHGEAQDDRAVNRLHITISPDPDTSAPEGGYKVPSVDKRRLQKLKRILQRVEREQEGGSMPEELTEDGKMPGGVDTEPPGGEGTVSPGEEGLSGDRSALLRARMEQRLSSARFRYINQQLYTSDSGEALRLFQSDPEAFTLYHRGFSQQVQRWPVNPITEIIKYIKNRPPSLVVADFGCGDALLARSVRNTVHSFDLVALNDHVTACDMAKVPLSDDTVDIAVFCLSLMGKNLSEFLQEANRVLKLGGVLLVAEVSSRFDDVRQFLSAMSQLGFKSISKSTDSSYFYLFEFSKCGSTRERVRHSGLELKPCLYKKR